MLYSGGFYGYGAEKYGHSKLYFLCAVTYALRHTEPI